MLDATAHPIATEAPLIGRQPSIGGRQLLLLKWAIITLCGAGIAAIPSPTGITSQAWHLLAIFVATIVGSILRPLPGGAMVLLGVTAVAVTGALRVEQVLLGYADPIVWLVLAAFMISRGLIKTGLGRRIAFLFIRAISKHSLGLGYALVITDIVLAAVIPSNGARSGGIIFPIAKSVSEAYESRPGPTAARLGTFLMTMLYQCEVIICAMFVPQPLIQADPRRSDIARRTTNTQPRAALPKGSPGSIADWLQR